MEIDAATIRGGESDSLDIRPNEGYRVLISPHETMEKQTQCQRSNLAAANGLTESNVGEVLRHSNDGSRATSEGLWRLLTGKPIDDDIRQRVNAELLRTDSLASRVLVEIGIRSAALAAGNIIDRAVEPSVLDEFLTQIGE